MNDIWYFSTTQYNENLMWQVKINGGEGTISKTHEQDDFAALVVWSLP